MPEEKLTPLEIARNEAEATFSVVMDELESQQDPKEPFIVRFGLGKGEKNPNSISAQHQETIDSRILLLIAPDDEGAFTVITKRGPKKIKPKDQAEAGEIQDIIDRCLTHGKGSFTGGFYRSDEKERLLIGYNHLNSMPPYKNNVAEDFDSSLLLVPSAEAVIASIQASRKLAHTRADETQKPLRDALEAVRESKETAIKLSDFLRNPLQPPAGGGTAAPPPSAPTG